MSHKLLTTTILLLFLEVAALWTLLSAFAPYTAGSAAGRVNRPDPAPLPRIVETVPEEILLRAATETQIVPVVSEAALGRALLTLLKKVKRPARSAELTIEDGRAANFVPDAPGQDLDVAAARRLALNLLTGNAAKQLTINLPVRQQAPKRTLGDLNALGIQSLIAQGITDFTGSSASRIQNIRVGAERFNGVIIMPGEEFSFNQYLGPVDGAHGFLPELVIKPEGTVPEFGGGLCQVSTTAFRAAFFAGLPITARRNHAYAVKYYDWIADDKPRAPGLDATIYPGALDLKFTNDMVSAILVWTRIEGKRLYFEFYGSPDGRQVAVDGPYPFDRKPDGAVKSTVTRRVTKNGETTEVTFKSNYASPDRYPRVVEYPKPAEPPLEPINQTDQPATDL